VGRKVFKRKSLSFFSKGKKMSVFNFLKKSKVPDELPDLVSDELGKNSENLDDISDSEFNRDNDKKSEKQEKKVELKEIEEGEDSEGSSLDFKKDGPKTLKVSKEDIDENGYAEEVKKAVFESEKSEKSFFNDLQKDITEEFSDLDKIEEWYKNDFSKKDVLSEMKDYWENEKTVSSLNNLGNEFKEKIEEKTKKLKKLEKEWQDTYFEMRDKEEELRDEEAELKELLSQFVEVCKKKKKSFGNEEKKSGRKKKK